MSRGIQIVAFLFCMVLATSFMGTIGAFAAVNAGTYDTQATDDTNRIVEVFEDQGSSVTGVAALDPIASFIIGGLDTIEVMWIVVTDAGELFELYGVPTELADVLETLSKLAFGLMIVYVIVRVRLD